MGAGARKKENEMSKQRNLLLALLISASTLSVTSAYADRRNDWQPHRSHDDGAAVAAGLVLGTALLWAATRPAPAYYETQTVAPVVIAPARMAAPPSADFWYYCRPAGSYYPYVATCPAAWEVVPARPY
jgi:hypothetical protein